MASGPVGIGQLAAGLGVSQRQAEKALDRLQFDLRTRGLRIQRSRRGVQLTTAPEAGPDLQRFLDVGVSTQLSQAALEVLAIVAYDQPVTRPSIDAIRGVNSDSSLRTLLRLGLVEEVGRSDGVGRPFLFATTPDFFHHFGLNSLKDLPPLDAASGSVTNGPDNEAAGDD